MVADGDRGGLLVGGDRDHDSRLSAWSIALVTRLRTIRSTRRTSASATQGASGARTTTWVWRWVGEGAGVVDHAGGPRR